MATDLYSDQVVIKKEDSSGDEHQEDSSSSEEEEEPEEEGKEDIDNNDNESSNSYSSYLTTTDWGLRSHEYQEDYWIGDSGVLSHMVVEDRNLFTKTPIQGKVKPANGTSIPMLRKGKMNVEAVPRQGKSRKGVLTVKVAKDMLHKLSTSQQLLCMIGKCMGQRKKMVIFKSN